MLSLPAGLLAELEKQDAQLFFSVAVGSPVSKTYKTELSRVPALRQSTRPLRRTPDISNISLVLADDEAKFNPMRTGSDFEGVNYHGATVTVNLGAVLPDGNETTTAVSFVGDLDDVVLDENDGTAELVCIDPLARLRRDDVAVADEGTEYKQVPPAFAIKAMLTLAGFGSRLNTASFNTGVTQETGAQQILWQYTIKTGKWWDNIQTMLKHVNAGLQFNAAGELVYTKYYPTAAAAAFTFDTATNVESLRVRRPGGQIVNYIVTQKRDTGGAEGTYTTTTGSPVEDSTSQTTFKVRRQNLSLEFSEDAIVEGVAGEWLEYQKDPPDMLFITATLETVSVELGDIVDVTHGETGRDFTKTGQVVDRAIDASRGTCKFTVLANSLTEGPWLFCDKGHLLDESKLVW